MSEQHNEKTKGHDVSKAAAPQPQTRQERQEERRREEAQVQAKNPAPADMFRKQSGANTGSNPERVKIIKAHIADYVKACPIAAGDTKATKMAAAGLVSAIRNLFTLNAGEVRGVTDALISAIRDDQGGAFNITILYRYVNEIKDSKERETFVAVMDLLTTVARLEDRSKIRTLKDIDYVLRHVTNEVAAKAFAAQFPAK